jgi:hypothetical protein
MIDILEKILFRICIEPNTTTLRKLKKTYAAVR